MLKANKIIVKPPIDLEELLHGNPTWEEVVRFWKEDGEFFEEKYHMAAIKRYLRTPEQKIRLDEADISLEELMSGSYGHAFHSMTQGILKEWNEKLGFHYYGSEQ